MKKVELELRKDARKAGYKGKFLDEYVQDVLSNPENSNGEEEIEESEGSEGEEVLIKRKKGRPRRVL